MKHDDPVELKLGESVDFIRSRCPLRPRMAIILGSGLGDFADSLDNNVSISTGDIPHYPRSTVQGHKGRLVFGKMGSSALLAFQGRVHFYESGILETILYPIRVAHKLGIRTIIVTNAAGGINRSFSPGDLMIITDQINLTMVRHTFPTGGRTGAHIPVYDKSLIHMALEEGQRLGIGLKQGTYCGVKGPSYETAGEVEMIRRSGGDAVGMSTVNEASFASELGMRIVGISCITNMATGILNAKLSHDEVTEVADRVKTTFSTFLRALITRIDSSH